MYNSKINRIIFLLNSLEGLTNDAEKEGFISSKNLKSDMIETLVSTVINAELCNNSQKGYDALRGKERIQIKFRSANKNGKYRIRFKNITKHEIGFDTLAFCCKTNEGYNIYEIDAHDLPNMRFNEEKNIKALSLSISSLEDICFDKHKVKS